MTKFKEYLKRFFTKKIYLPAWFFILNRPVNYSDFEDYDNTLKKIVNALQDGKYVVVRVNDQICKVELVNGQVKCRPLEKHEYKITL